MPTPSRPARRAPWTFGDREPIAVGPTLRNAVMRRGPSAPVRTERPAAAAPRRPRGGRDRGASAHGDGAAARPVVQHAAPGPLRPRQAHGPRPARADRGQPPPGLAAPDRVLRLRPADAAGRPRRRRLRTRLRHQHAPRVPAGPPGARRRPAPGQARDHGHRRRTDRPPRRRPVGLQLAADPRDPRGDPAARPMRLARAGIELDVFLLEDAPGLLAFAERSRPRPAARCSG